MAEKQRIIEKITNVRDIQTSPLDRAYAFLIRIIGYLLIGLGIGAYYFFKFLWANKEIVITVIVCSVGLYFFIKKKGYFKKKKDENLGFLEENEQSSSTQKDMPFRDTNLSEENEVKKNVYTRDYDAWRPQYDG